MSEEPTRKLAVLLHADVVGSTALVQKNETLAHQRMQDTFRRFSETIVTHGGIAHEIRGDALVAEFPKASDAVAAAVEFQKTNTAHNKGLDDDVLAVVRIGIAMGEVVVADNTVTGEGIVLAQRLEQLATPGGVCIQDAAYQTVPKRLPFVYESLGEHEVKGFDEPVRVYEVRPKSPVDESERKTSGASQSAIPELPDKPSIAVLPFTNMSGDPEQEYFSDGITEDIITALSKIRSFFVISRNSTFTYKGKSVSVQEVGRELGVRYVVEGSVRKAGARIRISVQLIDATTDSHVWAERYDRELDDFFTLQDELTETIVGVIEPELSEAERERSRRKPPESLDVWGLYQRGLWHMYQFHEEDNTVARRLLEQASQLDPTLAGAYAGLAHVGYWDVLFGYSDEPTATLEAAVDAGRKAIELDPKDPMAHWAIGSVYLLRDRHEDSIAELQTAIGINPSYAHAHSRLGLAFLFSGRHEDALTEFDIAIRMSPSDPSLYTFLAGRSMTLIMMKRYGEAEEWARRSVQQPRCGPLAHAVLAAALGHLDKIQDAQAALAEELKVNPKFSEVWARTVFRFKQPEDSQEFFLGLHRAGLSN